MSDRKELERFLGYICEWCGWEGESADEMERHRCSYAGSAELGVDAPSDWDDSRFGTAQTGRKQRPFYWRRGELDGIQSGDWKKGKRR